MAARSRTATALELSVPKRCHLQVSVAAAGKNLTFSVLDANGQVAQIRMLLGVATQPLERCPVPTGRSAVVVVPDQVRWVVLHSGNDVVAKRGVVPDAKQVTRVQF